MILISKIGAKKMFDKAQVRRLAPVGFMGGKKSYHLLFLTIAFSIFIACNNCPSYKPCPSIDLKYNVYLQNKMNVFNAITIFIKDGDTTKIKFKAANYGYGLLRDMRTDCDRQGQGCGCYPCTEPH